MISSLEVSDLVTNGVASACLDDLAALAFVEGTITPARHTQIVEHLETCAECRKLVGGVVEMTKLSDTLLATADSAPGGRPESFGSFRLGALIAQGGMGSI